MKIHVLSDLHLEFAPFQAPPTDADVVVLAGDINLGVRGIEWAKIAFPNRPVIYVAGNHEFYKHHWTKLLAELRATAADTNVHFLEDESLVIEGVRFFGCTLWTDFDLFGTNLRHAAMIEAEDRMTDYKKIRAPRVRPGFRDEYSKLKPIQTRDRCRRSTALLENILENPFDGPTVVVTHHLPSPQSLPTRFADSLASAAYASDLTDLTGSFGPDLWIHGHVHDSVKYALGNASVVCNPRGYRLASGSFENVAFEPSLTVEV